MNLDDHFLRNPATAKMSAAFAGLNPVEQLCCRSLSRTSLRSPCDFWQFLMAAPPSGDDKPTQNDVHLALYSLASGGFVTLVEGDWLTKEIDG